MRLVLRAQAPFFKHTQCLIHSFAFVPVLARCSDKIVNVNRDNFCVFFFHQLNLDSPDQMESVAVLDLAMARIDTQS